MNTLMDLLYIGTIYQSEDETNYEWLWEDIQIDARLNKRVLISNILQTCGKSYVVANTCAGFKQLSDIFFSKWFWQISKLLDTQELEYNPIWNKDGKIEERHDYERNKDRDVADDLNLNRNENYNGTDNNQVSAYNSGEYQPRDMTTYNNTRTQGGGENRDITEKENEGLQEHTVRIEQGNIGITTTQQLIREERELYNFNVYTWIVNKYREELFLQVW